MAGLARARLHRTSDGGQVGRSPYSVFHIRVSSSGLERILPHQLDDAGNRIIRPAARVRGKKLSSPLRLSHAVPRLPMRLPGWCTSRRSHGAGAFAPGRWTTVRRASCRAGRRGVAVERAQPDGDPSEKQRRRPPPRTTNPGRPRHDSDRSCCRVVFPGCRP